MSEPDQANEKIWTIFKEEAEAVGKMEAYHSLIQAGQSAEYAAKVLKITPEMIKDFEYQKQLTAVMHFMDVGKISCQ
jgi:hypothetical protein